MTSSRQARKARSRRAARKRAIAATPRPTPVSEVLARDEERYREALASTRRRRPLYSVAPTAVDAALGVRRGWVKPASANPRADTTPQPYTRRA